MQMKLFLPLDLQEDFSKYCDGWNDLTMSRHLPLSQLSTVGENILYTGEIKD